MIKVDFDPETFFANGAHADIKPAWDALMERAEIATNAVLAEWESYVEALPMPAGSKEVPPFKPKFEEQIWKDIRDWMSKNIFHDKCAYCETSLWQETIPDTEHFRPKRSVTMQSGKAKTSSWGVEIEHPGYFWLAYNWKNLLPSCHMCNRYEGKKTYFPATSYLMLVMLDANQVQHLGGRVYGCKNREGYYFVEPKYLDELEDPQLLHPIFSDPRKHIAFDLAGNAIPKGNSDKGKESIKAFALNHTHKVGWRFQAQTLGYLDIMARIAVAVRTNPQAAKSERDKVLGEYRQKPYAAAIYDYFWEMNKILLSESAAGHDQPGSG